MVSCGLLQIAVVVDQFNAGSNKPFCDLNGQMIAEGAQVGNGSGGGVFWLGKVDSREPLTPPDLARALGGRLARNEPESWLGDELGGDGSCWGWLPGREEGCCGRICLNFSESWGRGVLREPSL